MLHLQHLAGYEFQQIYIISKTELLISVYNDRYMFLGENNYNK